jgi:hypothetical protein
MPSNGLNVVVIVDNVEYGKLEPFIVFEKFEKI